MTPTILIVGQLPDLHIQAVVGELQQLGVEPLVFDRIFPEQSRLTYWLDSVRAGGEISAAGRAVRLEALDAVWWRVKPYSLIEYGAQPKPVRQDFIDREWRSVLDSLSFFTPRAFWVNPRSADLLAREKPIQLQAARQAGFAIPPTCISNDPQAVTDFIGGGDGAHIYKPVTWYVDLPDRFIFTSQVELEQVSEGVAEIHVAPGIFQRRVPKACELRVTVVGEEIFPVRIDSQALPGAELDWRRMQNHLDYQPCALPDEVCQRLLALQRKLGLVYGAYDLILTPQDEYVFLEVNPLGQWLWLERLTGAPIALALAKTLLQAQSSTAALG